MDQFFAHDAAMRQSDPNNPPATTRKRRPHKKSRAGCENCKRRRCDEQLPSCRNCIRFSLRCNFIPPSEDSPASSQSPTSDSAASWEQIPQPSQTGDPPVETKRRRGRPRKDWTNSATSNPKPGSSSTSTSNSTSKPGSSIPPAPAQDEGPALADLTPALSSFNMDDMELFHHYLTDPILQQGDDVSLWRDRVPLLAFRHPCVLQLLLAVSALHLSRLQPTTAESRARYYRQLADARATVGLRQTAQLLPRLSRENCGALYIATILVVVFSLAKGPSPTDLLVVADDCVEPPWWEPVRGIRLVFGTMGPEAIFSGVLAPPKGSPEGAVGETVQEKVPVPAEGGGVVPAVALLWEEVVREIADLIAASPGSDTEMFQRMLDGLSSCFGETFGTLDQPKSGTIGRFEVVMSWVYRLEDNFTLRVGQRNPVAVVLLAHFAVLLQTMEYAWFMEGWAAHILHRTTEMLGGGHFARWLRWPTDVINELAAQSTMCSGDVEMVQDV